MKPIFYCCIALLLLLSCGNDQSGSQASTAPSVDNRQELKVLTWRYLTRDADIIKAFEERYNARVTMIVKPLGELLRQAQSKQLPAVDIILLPSIEDAVRMREFGALQPFFVDSFTTGDVDDRFIDNEGYYAGLSRWTMASVYNPNAVTQTEASTYGNVAKLPLRGIRIGVAHPDSSGLAGVVSGLIAGISPEAANIWAKIMYTRSEGGPQGNDYDQLDRMLAGELDMALVSSGALVRWYLNGNPRHYEAAKTWGVRFPKTDNNNVNFFNMTCIGVGYNAPNRPLAMQFVDFMYEEPNQDILGNSWYEYPGQMFTTPNEYLLNLPDPITSQVPAEVIDQNIMPAWGIINGIASEVQ